MRKILTLAIIFIIFAGSVNAAGYDGWYQYNTSGKVHNFSVRFPTDWKSQSISDTKYGFSPISNYDDPLYLIQEFHGEDFDQVINYYLEDGESLVSSTDFLFRSNSEDLIAKKVIYSNLELKLIKRGTVIFAFKRQSKDYQDIFDQIFNSFYFKDDWHQYIDLGESYSFIFPKNLDLNTISHGVQILDQGSTIFTVILNENGKFKNNGKSYQLTTSSQHSSRTEIVESFDFFDIAGLSDDYASFLYFTDVRDNHQNSTAINRLVKDKVINGYDDGTFKPDGEINRAELTKMVVATKSSPDPVKYKNCFPDVKEEWFAAYICYAKNRDWVKGYDDGTFKPEAKVNRVEAIKIMIEALTTEDLNTLLTDKSMTDIDLKAWYGPYYTFASNNNLLDKQHVTNNKYLPGGSIARKEVAETIYRIQQMP